jgi:hypothetical protein
MASFSSLLGWLRAPLWPGVRSWPRRALLVSGLYNLRGTGVAAGLSAGLSWLHDATRQMLKRGCGKRN